MSSRRVRISVAVLAVALIVPSMATAQEVQRTKPAVLEDSTLSWCGDVEAIRADPARYDDSPVYVGNPPTSELRRWAQRRPGFVDIWIDRENLGWITVAFTEKADDRQRQMERRFPDLGVVAVEVEYSATELKRLQRRVGRIVFPRGGAAATAVDTSSNTVSLHLGELDDEIIALVEAEFPGEPLCVDGPVVTELVADGPQPTAGNGWQLVGVLQAPGSPVYRTGIATDRDQLETLWLEAGMAGEPPPVDFMASVVLWFAQPHGSSCSDLRLDEVTVDHERAVVYPLIVMPDDPLMCTADIAGAYQFFVALPRDRLPEGSFWIQLDADDPPPGAPEERTVVEVDLRLPGSTAGPADLHLDPSVGEPRALRSGAVMELGYPALYQFDVSCGIGYLGEINGIHWVTTTTGLPAAWAPLVDEGGQLDVDVRLRGGADPRAIAEAAGQRVRYEPFRDAPPSCEG